MKNKLAAYKYHVFSLIFFAFTGFNAVKAQLCLPGKPFPLEYPGISVLRVYDIYVNKEAVLQAIKNDTSSLKLANTGTLLKVKYNTMDAGRWDTLNNGIRLWRAAFHVEGASALDLIFSPYKVQKGVRIFIYDQQQQYVTGAFSGINNKPFKLLATSQIPGDFIVVEIQLPAEADSIGSFGISGIGCDFGTRLKIKTATDDWYGESDWCNIDVNCTDDAMIQQMKYSVVSIVMAGTKRCTGTLINTTRHDGIDYILTAGHCLADKGGLPNESDANTAVFYFDYESPYCNGPDGNRLKSLSGSTIRAFSSDVDFALLQLFEPIPFTYHPYYAGWDHSGNTVNSAVAIHHPLGDVKKISIEEHPLLKGSYGGYDANKHFIVQHWESGTTEKGSSGAPLFNSSGHIVGTLTGGHASCVESTLDYFAMLSHSWKDYANPINQLAFWLDPLNYPTKTLDGYDPYAAFRQSGDTLGNILHGDSIKLETGNLIWGNYSGNNSDHLSGIAEEFNPGRTKKVMGVRLDVAKTFSNPDDSLTISVWDNLKPERVLYKKQISVSDMTAGKSNFIEFDSAVTAGNKFYAGFEMNTALINDTSIFAIDMAASRAQVASNTAWVKDDQSEWWTLTDYTGNMISSSFAIFPLVYDSVPAYSPILRYEFTVFPNPAINQTVLFFNEIIKTTLNVSIFNLMGEKLFEKDYGKYQNVIPLNLSLYSGGIYIIWVRYEGVSRSVKLLIVK